MFKVCEKNVEDPESNSTSEGHGKEIYVKAVKMRSLDDLEKIKNEIRSGNILIVRLTPLAETNIEDIKKAIDDLHEFTLSLGGDIARLGEERIVITPENIKIWRE
ncbi:MAG: cell division protein SepF, partial [Candidatus Bathyarchaeia archaeon]